MLVAGLAVAVSVGREARGCSLVRCSWGGVEMLTLSAAVATLLVAPFVIARLSGHGNWPLAGVGAVAAFLLAFTALGVADDDLLPGLVFAVAVGGSIALRWRAAPELGARAVAVVALTAVALAATHADARWLAWVTEALALPALGLADAVSRVRLARTV